MTPNNLIKVKELPIKKDGYEFTCFDEFTSGTVEAVIANWPEQLELKSPKLILDIGANVGVWSFYMARKYPETFIMAIEPGLANVNCFKAGVDKNKFTNIALLKCAIADKPITLRSHKSNSGSASAFIPVAHNFRNEFVSEVVTLNKLFDEITMNVDLMKLDIEGSEYDVFKDFKHWNSLEALTIEFHPWPRFKTKQEQKEKTDELLKLIKDGMGDKPIKYIYPELHEDDDDFHTKTGPDLKIFDEELKRLGL